MKKLLDNCENCGKSLRSVRMPKGKAQRRTACSQKCVNKLAQKRRLRNEPKRANFKYAFDATCAQCGTAFKALRLDCRFCSGICCRKWWNSECYRRSKEKKSK